MDDTLTLSSEFDPSTEADWRASVEKALKGKGPETLETHGTGGLVIRPLYRETDVASSKDPLGHPGSAPFLRGATAQRDPHLPWDIRQVFTHPEAGTTNGEILRDLERGVSSIELKLDCTGEQGVSLCTADDFNIALEGVRADIAPIALDHGGGTGTSASALLALWAERQDNAKTARLDFNIDPLGSLARLGLVEGGLDTAFKRLAALNDTLSLRFPLAHTIRVDARMVREAGGLTGHELGAAIASGIDTLRRLDAVGVPADRTVPRMVFAFSTSANYGLEIAKLRAARMLWARCLEAIGIEPQPMVIQACTANLMLTRYDPWVNMLRATAACFAGGVGGADIVSVSPFNAPLGTPDELGRRVARNTQIIAQEESHLGKVADPAGGAWFTEKLTQDLAEAAWAIFQEIEAEGGYGISLMADAFQARVAEYRAKRRQEIATRQASITGVSEFPLLNEVPAPVAEPSFANPREGISDTGLKAMVPGYRADGGEDSEGEPFWPIRLSEPFERLRDHAAARETVTGRCPAIFLATLGPLAEHTARVDYARNFFAAGGIEAKAAPTPPSSIGEMVAAWNASGCVLAILCGSDNRYSEEAEAAAKRMKAEGVQRLYLAGKPRAQEDAWRAAGIDSFIHMGVDVVSALELAHAELGIGT
ncbi:MAG: methylmalonyl-CoA mutase family protein [Pseudomonadota bacterium]